MSSRPHSAAGLGAPGMRGHALGGIGTGTEGNLRASTVPSLSSPQEHADRTAQPSPSASCLSCDRPLDQKPLCRHEDRIRSLPFLLSSFEEEMSVLLARTQLEAQHGLHVDQENSNTKSKLPPHHGFNMDLDERYDTRITLTRPDPRSG